MLLFLEQHNIKGNKYAFIIKDYSIMDSSLAALIVALLSMFFFK